MGRQSEVAVRGEHWVRASDSIRSAAAALSSAVSSDDCQAIGLRCREALCSLAQAVTPQNLALEDGTTVSATDSKRRLDVFLAAAAAGSSRGEVRAFAKHSVNLSSMLVHKRTATLWDARLCLCATEATAEIVGLLAGLTPVGPSIDIGFDAQGLPKVLDVVPTMTQDVPSIRYRQRIEFAIDAHKKGVVHQRDLSWELRVAAARALGMAKPLEMCDLSELEAKLKAFEPDLWAERDAYERFEEKGTRVNIALYNAGDQYLEDTTVWLRIPKVSGLALAERILQAPPKAFKGPGQSAISPVSFLAPARSYPSVGHEPEHWVATARVGDLKHKLSTQAFQQPLRFSVTEEAAGKVIPLQCSVHGKQLKDILSIELLLVVAPRPLSVEQ